MKRCPGCEETKDSSEYHKGSETDGLQAYCKPCHRERQKLSYERRIKRRILVPSTKACVFCREEKPASEFFKAPGTLTGLTSRCKPCYMRQQTARKRGLTETELLAMEQRCALCAAVEDLVVDHCHATLAVRGLLCRTCNSGLGMFRDDTDLMRRAIAYLESFRV